MYLVVPFEEALYEVHNMYEVRFISLYQSKSISDYINNN
jgi:hypothetical protein